MRSNDQYAPLVLRYDDPDTGQLIGGALTCRAQVAAMAQMTGGRLPAQMFGRTGPMIDFGSVMDLHNELDLMCVTPPARGRGVGAALLAYMEQNLRSRGVKVWFGNATPDLETDKLREFYGRHGFTVLADGQPLPPLLGRPWIAPTVDRPAFYFYKKLR